MVLSATLELPKILDGKDTVCAILSPYNVAAVKNIFNEVCFYFVFAFLLLFCTLFWIDNCTYLYTLESISLK